MCFDQSYDVPLKHEFFFLKLSWCHGNLACCCHASFYLFTISLHLIKNVSGPASLKDKCPPFSTSSILLLAMTILLAMALIMYEFIGAPFSRRDCIVSIIFFRQKFWMSTFFSSQFLLHPVERISAFRRPF